MAGDHSLMDLLQDADARLFPGANAGELVSLLQRLRRDLKLEPPDDYMEFLRHSDGMVADGLMLYGTRTRQIDDAEMPELVEINLQRRSYRDDLDDVLQLGEIDDDIVGFHPADRHYWRIERISGECLEKFDDLQALVTRCVGGG
jgi:hypothetical protein